MSLSHSNEPSQSKKLIALVDCNNFFVSCERLFNPKLHNRPVAVLSSNDGCIIARSQEVKDLGVPMGAPYFQWAPLLKGHQVTICSSNFSLYADLSHRVMETLSYFNPQLEIYSIDEAFLSFDLQDPIAQGHLIRHKVLQWTGIPVSIGIASTKTLAKIANRSAKKDPSSCGVCFPSEEQMAALLERLPVKEVWGIGERLSLFLSKKGIHTAAQLCAQPDLWIKQNLSVVGLRTVWELQGKPCLEIEEARAAKHSILTSRSFGRPVLTQEELIEAVCSFTVRGAEKLREERSRASWLQVFITSKPSKEEPYYSNYAHLALPEPTAYTPTLLGYATQGLKSIFRSGLTYKRAGILLGGLVPASQWQPNLFLPHDSKNGEKKRELMHLIDQANESFGYRILQFASEGIERPWQRKSTMCSPRFTTQWSELLTIKI